MKKSYLLFLLALLGSCSRKSEDTAVISSTVVINFSHYVNGAVLVTDSMIYITPPGNTYMVNDLQYFISDVVFYPHNGTKIYVTDDDSIHYTDIAVPSSLTWKLKTVLPAGSYDSVAFVFGMNGQRNRSNRFPNPPERDMFWPEVLGGGYHYMKMNLEWKNATMQVPGPFNMHVGIGQTYGSGAGSDSITGFVQNDFTVTIPLTSFTLATSGSRVVDIRMNIDKWFDGDEVFNFADYPYGIMQDEAAMQKACRNGRHAFELHLSK